MIWLAYAAVFILLARILVVVANLLSRPYLMPAGDSTTARVSVLIPARNEENNLPVVMEGLLDQADPEMEFLLYDDESTDRTGEIMRSYAGRDHRVRNIRSEPLPPGWSGKNHACHRLSMEASGEYFLFLDADVKVARGLISRAVREMRQHDLALLSLFPVQEMNSPGEMLTVPVMNWILLSLLPLRLVWKSRYASLAAANGQFMLFRAEEYRSHRFHELFRGINVEDIHIMRRIKKLGYNARTLLSDGGLTCRMYHSFGEGASGLTRSMLTFFGGSVMLLLLFTFFSTAGFILVWLAMSPVHAASYLALSLVMRGLILWMSRQQLLKLMVLTPLIQIAFLWIVILTLTRRARGRNLWKDRIISFKRL